MTALNYNLVQCAGLHQQTVHLLKVVIALVNVDEHLALAQVQHLFQGGHFVAGYHSMSGSQTQFLHLLQCQVRYLALAVGGTVYSGIVNDHQFVVLGLPYINLNHVHAHLNAALECLNGVFGRVAPVAAVRHNGYILRFVVKEFFSETRNGLFCPCLCHAEHHQGQNDNPFHRICTL